MKRRGQQAAGSATILLVLAGVVSVLLGWIHVTPLGVRSLGGILQILGIAELALELRKVSKRLYPGRKLAITRVWLRLWASLQKLATRRPWGKRQSINISGPTAGVTSHAPPGAVTIDMPERDMAVTARLELHETQITKLRRQADQLRTEISTEHQERDEQIIAVRRQGEGENHEVRVLISDLLGAGLHLQWFAGLFLIAGVSCTTWPAGIAHFFRP